MKRYFIAVKYLLCYYYTVPLATLTSLLSQELPFTIFCVPYASNLWYNLIMLEKFAIKSCYMGRFCTNFFRCSLYLKLWGDLSYFILINVHFAFYFVSLLSWSFQEKICSRININLFLDCNDISQKFYHKNLR